jgi:hypothetical protein
MGFAGFYLTLFFQMILRQQFRQALLQKKKIVIFPVFP